MKFTFNGTKVVLRPIVMDWKLPQPAKLIRQLLFCFHELIFHAKCSIRIEGNIFLYRQYANSSIIYVSSVISSLSHAPILLTLNWRK